MSGPDYIIDIHGLPHPEEGGDGQRHNQAQARQPGAARGRPWLALKWNCCSVYSRVYRNRQGTAYDARCPKCARPVRIRVGEGGTSNRFFEVD